MKKCLLPGLLLAASICVFADQAPAEKLAARSGLPLPDIKEFLANCDSDDQTQQGIYFCTWRDLIVAEHELQQTINQIINQHPDRKAALETHSAQWKKERDTKCRETAHNSFGGGSIESTAAVTCEAILTENLTKAMKRNSSILPNKASLPRHLPAVRSHGLKSRQHEESAPFLHQ